MGRFRRMPGAIDRVKQFFIPPVFAEDEEKNRVAASLFVILSLELVGVFAMAVAAVFAILPPLTLIVGPTIIVLMLMLLHLAKRGDVDGAAFIYVLSTWAMLMLSALDSGGLQAVGYITGGLLTVLLAGLLLRRRHIFTFYILTVLFGVGLTWLQVNNLLPAVRATDTPLSRLTAYSVFLLVGSGLAFATVRSIQSSLENTRKRLVELNDALAPDVVCPISTPLLPTQPFTDAKSPPVVPASISYSPKNP